MLPLRTIDYINEKMNCEDIAMNFLISNLTGKAPVKVHFIIPYSGMRQLTYSGFSLNVRFTEKFKLSVFLMILHNEKC